MDSRTTTTATTATIESAPPLREGARTAYAVVALTAWAGSGLVTLLNLVDGYEHSAPEGHTYGDNAAGMAGAFGRLADHFSYFTEWSNIVVAVTFTLLALAPAVRTTLRRVLLLDSLIMITVTAIVYAVLLAPTETVTGWSVLTNPWQHKVVPALTVLVWLIWGPHGWISWRLIPAALIIPVAWIVWALARGAVVGAYPYGFLDVATHGYGSVFTSIGGILVFAMVVALIYIGLDRLLARRNGSSSSEER